MQSGQDGFTRWQAPGRPLVVECSLMVMEELRAAAVEGFQKIAHGGVEIGGVLCGSHEGGIVKVLDWVPIHCEHAKGPGFELSSTDREGLARLLEDLKSDTDLAGMEAVGWFHTHTRSRIWLSPQDLEIHQAFFPEDWQVALVLQPRKDAPLRAGYFFREEGGRVHCEDSLLEFEIRPSPLPPRRPARDLFRPYAPRRRASAGLQRTASAPAGVAAPPQASGVTARKMPARAAANVLEREDLLEEPPRRAFPWRTFLVIAVLVLAAGLAFQFRGLLLPGAPEPLGLRLEEAEDQLVIVWSRTARPVAQATGGLLEIADGPEVREVRLSGTELQGGAVTYARQFEDVEVRLKLYRGAALAAEEATRFLGQRVQPKTSEQLEQAVKERDALNEEAVALREELRKQQGRSRVLLESVRALEKRIQTDRPQSGEQTPQAAP